MKKPIETDIQKREEIVERNYHKVMINQMERATEEKNDEIRLLKLQLA